MRNQYYTDCNMAGESTGLFILRNFTVRSLDQNGVNSLILAKHLRATHEDVVAAFKEFLAIGGNEERYKHDWRDCGDFLLIQPPLAFVMTERRFPLTRLQFSRYYKYRWK